VQRVKEAVAIVDRGVQQAFESHSLSLRNRNLTEEFYRPIGTLLVAQLVKALCYKPEGCGIDSRWCHWNFSLT